MRGGVGGGMFWVRIQDWMEIIIKKVSNCFKTKDNKTYIALKLMFQSKG